MIEEKGVGKVVKKVKEIASYINPFKDNPVDSKLYSPKNLPKVVDVSDKFIEMNGVSTNVINYLYWLKHKKFIWPSNGFIQFNNIEFFDKDFITAGNVQLGGKLIIIDTFVNDNKNKSLIDFIKNYVIDVNIEGVMYCIKTLEDYAMVLGNYSMFKESFVPLFRNCSSDILYYIYAFISVIRDNKTKFVDHITMLRNHPKTPSIISINPTCQIIKN